MISIDTIYLIIHYEVNKIKVKQDVKCIGNFYIIMCKYACIQLTLLRIITKYNKYI